MTEEHSIGYQEGAGMTAATTNIWQLIAAEAERVKPMPVETTLLGFVPYSIDGADVIGLVPDHIAYTAQEYRLEILPPDPRNSSYFFRRMY